MARSGLLDIIARLRDMVDDGSANIWEDDDLQNILDQHRYRVWREPLEMELTYTSGTTYEYKVYHSRWDNFESGGTAYFKVEDAAGSARGTSEYSVNYVDGVVTMSADQEGTALYLTGWSYDLAGAAAECWRQRAAKVSSYYNVDADGHRLSRSQWFDHCLKISDYYARQARPITVRAWHQGLMRDE